MEHDEENKQSMLASHEVWLAAAAGVILWAIVAVMAVRMFW